MAPGDDYRHELLGVSWMLTCVSAVFVAGRFFCRFHIRTKIGWDDIWAAFSLVMSFAMSISWTVYADFQGTLDAPHTPEQQIRITFTSWLSQTWCITGIVTTKLAVAALIMRLQGPARWRTWTLWILCGISAAWGVIQIGFVWGQCRPAAALWDPRGHPDAVCWSPTVVVYNGIAVSSFWAFVDIALAAIPVHMVLNLQIPLRRKVAICLLLSTGLFAAAMSIVRTTRLPADLERNSDIVHEFVMFFIWNALEINSLIISCCVPALVPLWEIVRGRSGKSRAYGTGASGGANYGSNRGLSYGSASRKGTKWDKLNTDSSQQDMDLESLDRSRFDHPGGNNGHASTASAQDSLNLDRKGIKITREVNISESMNHAS